MNWRRSKRSKCATPIMDRCAVVQNAPNSSNSNMFEHSTDVKMQIIVVWCYFNTWSVTTFIKMIKKLPFIISKSERHTGVLIISPWNSTTISVGVCGPMNATLCGGGFYMNGIRIKTDPEFVLFQNIPPPCFVANPGMSGGFTNSPFYWIFNMKYDPLFGTK